MMETQAELDARFRIRAPLRCDGVGSLDCAEDMETGERLAIRWLPLAANGAVAAKALEKLPVHPVLPQIRKTGLTSAAAYVAMNFPDGKLVSALGEEVLGLPALSRLGVAVADALAALHLQGLVHGELCGDSVLVLPDGKFILWDLPLVVADRLTDRRKEERAVAQLFRAAPFLAPERARGGAPSLAADVYGLGALLTVAAGAPLPRASTTLNIIHSIATGAWRPSAPATMRGPLAAVVERLMATEPSSRPSAEEAAKLLADAAPRMEVILAEDKAVLVDEDEEAPAVAEVLSSPPARIRSEPERERLVGPAPHAAPVREPAVALPRASAEHQALWLGPANAGDFGAAASEPEGALLPAVAAERGPSDSAVVPPTAEKDGAFPASAAGVSELPATLGESAVTVPEPASPAGRGTTQLAHEALVRAAGLEGRGRGWLWAAVVLAAVAAGVSLSLAFSPGPAAPTPIPEETLEPRSDPVPLHDVPPPVFLKSEPGSQRPVESAPASPAAALGEPSAVTAEAQPLPAQVRPPAPTAAPKRKSLKRSVRKRARKSSPPSSPESAPADFTLLPVESSSPASDLKRPDL